MKTVKKVLFLLGLLAGVVATVFVGTAIVQFGMIFLSEKTGIAISEDVLYQVSGSCGIVIASLLCAGYARKKKYTECVVAPERFCVKRAIFYMILSVCICKVVLNSAVTLLCAHIIPVTEQVSGNVGGSYIDLLFGLIVAPIFEEVLFRRGIYSLLRAKFRMESAILIGALSFALIHGYQLQGFLSCLSAGIVLGLIYDKTGNLWYCIGAHMFCNLFAYIMNGLEKRGVTMGGMPLQYEVNGYNTYHPVIIVLAALFCVGLILQKNKGKIRKTR